jgi:hypothetical protein
LQQVIDGFADGQLDALFEQLREIFALEILHDHVRRAILESADVAHAHYVLALDLRYGPRFSAEAQHGVRVGGRVGEQKLDGNSLVELKVRCLDDHTHSTLTEHAFDTVFVGEDAADLNR